MKKSLLALSTLLLFAQPAHAEQSWYAYNDSHPLHSFHIEYPDDWKLYTDGDDIQGLAPKGEEEFAFTIREFESQSESQIVSQLGEALVTRDLVFPTYNEDLIAKDIEFADSTARLIKRGSLTLALIMDHSHDADTLTSIQNTFYFTDDWHQYIDLNDKYSFVFPSNFTISSLSDGIEVLAPNQIFSIQKYENTPIAKAATTAETSTASLVSQKSTSFNGSNKAILAVYKDKLAGKQFARLFVEKNGHSYGLTEPNIETNFPSLDHFYEEIVEMQESFAFFSSDLSGYDPFLYFPDVRGTHPNAAAINQLYKDKVINGYPDGTFQPDGLINRAELSKMLVATLADPSARTYKNCFPDVHEEWYARYICYAQKNSWVQGYPDGKFLPAQNINRVEAMKIVLEALVDLPATTSSAKSPYTDVDYTKWYGKYFSYALTNNLLDTHHVQDKKFLPDAPITRKEVAELIFRTREQNR